MKLSTKTKMYIKWFRWGGGAQKGTHSNRGIEIILRGGVEKYETGNPVHEPTTLLPPPSHGS